MADVINPQKRLIANEKIRPLADRLGQLYNFCKALQGEAAAEGWTAMFPATADIIIDGAREDGRTEITSGDIANIMTMATDVITWFEAAAPTANFRRNLALKVAVNPERI